MPGERPDKALAHRVVTNMINWLYARHGHVTYLQDYLNEYCYRYSRHRMKGEKNPGEGSEIEPETVCVQAVGAPQGVTAYPLYNGSASYFQWQG